MIIILGLVILVAAGIAGVTGVLANGGHAHAVTHFAVFGYPPPAPCSCTASSPARWQCSG